MPEWRWAAEADQRWRMAMLPGRWPEGGAGALGIIQSHMLGIDTPL
jgi:hypothetical protein